MLERWVGIYQQELKRLIERMEKEKAAGEGGGQKLQSHGKLKAVEETILKKALATTASTSSGATEDSGAEEIIKIEAPASEEDGASERRDPAEPIGGSEDEASVAEPEQWLVVATYDQLEGGKWAQRKVPFHAG